MASIELQDICLSYADTPAVDRVSMTVPARSFLALLGPSGCGKTSLLRLIAGLERPSSGRLAIDGETLAGPGRFVEPQDRRLGMVFQSYALWPNMSVAGNIRFGLGPLRLGREARERRVDEALALVSLSAERDRRPHELSGGQRQRVALARSLAARPRVLLLDEPLANLDAHLRQTMLAEFRRLHGQTGTTMVLVTHDQNEAMAVADRVAVMNGGRLEQLASPQELFERPATPMVARFVGQGRTLPVEAAGRTADDLCRLRVGEGTLSVPGSVDTGPAWLCLRAGDIETAADGLAATVTGHRFENGGYILSASLDALPEADDVELRADRPLPPGSQIRLRVKGGWALPRETDWTALTFAARASFATLSA